ncbi:fucose isomerase [Verrucomicrobium sp. GAS474]|uniref:fucose isomerase n=1 Tax=Verrucomicrobium sp. GAS474 TaxID=1882831 RepID=UPI000B899B50|nr:fucose isomerase [Verrucomicrobium sp. GAS474]
MKKKLVYLVANGDLRASANQKCEAAQAGLEASLVAAIEAEGHAVKRAHGFDKAKGHGFIDSQKYGMAVFRLIPKEAPVIVAEAVWQYSHHLLPGLAAHRGPILTVANWSGTWPGLVGMLNLNGSLTKQGVPYSTLWSEDFASDAKFLKNLRSWLTTGKVRHDTSHVAKWSEKTAPASATALGTKFAKAFREQQQIMGIFDEGCMGMYNAIIPDHLLHATGVFKERLSQSALYARTLTVTDAEARAVYRWWLDKGMKFQLGKDEETDLTENQVLLQAKTYIAAVRIADDFGCATVGIQYQQGLKDLLPASDLVEGTLNNVDRPPVYREGTRTELFKREALPHFNEVDECAGLDGLVTYQLWKKLGPGFEPENTLHDLRWARHYQGKDGAGKALDAYVWVFEISGAVPPAHLIGGWKGTTSERQPAMYFRLGGGTVKGVSKPGWVVWSRVFVEGDALHYDTGLAEVVSLPQEETDDRLKLTTSQWPIMHAVLQGVSRDQMMARHKANHIQVVYAPDKAGAKKGLHAKAAAMKELGLKVSICGTI